MAIVEQLYQTEPEPKNEKRPNQKQKKPRNQRMKNKSLASARGFFVLGVTKSPIRGNLWPILKRELFRPNKSLLKICVSKLPFLRDLIKKAEFKKNENMKMIEFELNKKKSIFCFFLFFSSKNNQI